MKIRKATKKDEKEFLKVQKKAFPNLNSKKQALYFEEKIKKKEIFVAEQKGEYAGHNCFGKYLLAPPFSRGVFLEELAVKKKFRGEGIGTNLINALIKFCKKNKINMFYLSTGDFKANKAIKYYKKLGFKIVGKMKDINPKSEYSYGEIFMAKVIK
ncbi:GNAT family N-acetyltransferase [archaeon]|nr:GNAT family N-acetyltransferase [archaeon]MBT4373588.1 GNAT family N-acetyltransferase [archaeon]MBT4532036.1 GNAT family N-acetyltransferase [archaeon]MBT7001703.1 GNAT family N-acetyltransferase [archaeon]MBT7282405.1 GNAT family N-acetyltransferase [archaeon]